MKKADSEPPAGPAATAGDDTLRNWLAVERRFWRVRLNGLRNLAESLWERASARGSRATGTRARFEAEDFADKFSLRLATSAIRLGRGIEVKRR